MRKFCTTLLLLTIGIALHAQQTTTRIVGRRPAQASKATALLNDTRFVTGKTEQCGFSTMLSKARQKGFNDALFEQEVDRLIRQRVQQSGRTAFSGPVTIPVIFHVLYRTGDVQGNTSANLSYSKYVAQVNQLNKDYANLSGSIYGVAADVQLRFCLAVVDPAGRALAEPGVERINAQALGWSNTNTMSQSALMTFFDNTAKPATYWDSYSYLNIWTAAMNTSGLLGYATFPSLSTLQGLDETETDQTAGAVINWTTIGSTTEPGSSTTYGYGRTLTHELGHFFGLRHIWGDSNCGNDYCADTPPQFEETTGCPSAGTLNGCTPSVAKMFQNYMDYSNDACLNTFTLNQAQRCWTVMDNSPCRKALINSKACQARAANAVSFSTSQQSAYLETAATGNCPSTTSYTFKVYPAGPPTAATTLTFAGLSGTAALNRDYTVSPAAVTFATGDTVGKTITVSIIDDQEEENTETMEIGYVISGGGLVPGPDKQTLQLTIVDDDIAAIRVNNTLSTATLLSENFNASASLPSGWTTQIYSDGSGTPNQWVISANGGSGTTGNAAHITSNTGTKPNQYSNTIISDAYLFTPLVDATNLRDLAISFKWRCRGESGYDMGFIGYVPEGQTPSAENVIFFNNTFYGQSSTASAATASLTLPSALSNKKFYFVFNWFNDETQGNNPPFTIDDVLITGNAFAVATSTVSDTAFVQYSGQSVNYYSKSGSQLNIIAKVAGVSENIGCVNASVQQAGSSKIPLVTGTGSYQRSAKIIRLSPAVANTTATYSLTLYYTTAELDTWGAEVATLKVLKIKDNADPFGVITAADAALFTPVVDDQRAARGYVAFTINATGGFSQFMLASSNTSLPVSLADFTARPVNKTIVLNWSTSQEVNNKGFAIEKSTDGVQFNQVAFEKGQGNSSVTSFYTFTDQYAEPGVVYYYRLRQLDFDGAAKLSVVRQASIAKSNVVISLSPNPAKNTVKVFVGGIRQAFDINIINAAGQRVAAWQKMGATGMPATLNISSLTPGLYFVQVLQPEGVTVQKLIVR